MRYAILTFVLLISSASCGAVEGPPESCPRGSPCSDKWKWEHECNKDPNTSEECKKIFEQGIANSLWK